MKLIFILIGLAILTALAVPVATAYSIENYTATPMSPTSISQSAWRGQVLRVGYGSAFTGGVVRKVQLWFNVTDLGNYTILLQNVTGPAFQPNGQNISIGSFVPASLGNSTPQLKPYNITLSPALLVNGFNYTIIVLNNASSGVDNGPWAITSPSALYRAGNFTLSADAGVTWANSSADMPFTLYSSDNGLEVTLVSPTNGSSSINTSRRFIASALPIMTNLTNATIYQWYTNSTPINSSMISMNSTTNASEFIMPIPVGSSIWNVLMCGRTILGDTCSLAEQNFTVIRDVVQNDGELYDASVLDTDNSTFNLNISLVSSATLFSASLVYNGTSYIVPTSSITNPSAGIYILKKTIDIPGVSSDTIKNFYWSLTMDVGSGFTTSTTTSHTQIVNRTTFLSTGTLTSVNYSIYDEETLARISSTFQASFTWYLGSGTETRNASFSPSAGISFGYYTLPSNETFFTSATILLGNTTDNQTYASRTFNFAPMSFNGTVTNISLFLPNSSRTTSVIIEAKDNGLVPLPNYYVTISRYYPSDYSFRVVENKRTDVFGQLSTQLIPDTVRYKFQFADSNGTIKKTIDNVYITCRSTIVCLTQFIIRDDTDDFNRLRDRFGLITTLNFTNATNTFLFTWDDVTGDNPVFRLQVTRYLINSSSVVCNSTSSLTKGFLSCSVGSGQATYKAQVYRAVGSKESRIANTCDMSNVINCGLLDMKIFPPGLTFNLEKFFWSFIILGTCIGIGAFYPPVGVAMYLITFLVLGFMGLIYFTIPIFIAECVIGVLFIWAFRG